MNYGVRLASEDAARQLLGTIGARGRLLPPWPASAAEARPAWPGPQRIRIVLLWLVVGLCAAGHRFMPRRLARCSAAADVQQRLQQAGVRGKTITLKIMQRRPVRALPRPVDVLRPDPPCRSAAAAAAFALLPVFPSAAGPHPLPPQHATHTSTTHAQGAPEPAKFLGHGICDNHARSGACGAPPGSAACLKALLS